MGIHFLCLMAPELTWVFEVTNQFLFFGVYADDRQPHLEEFLYLDLNVFKLLIPVWMRWSSKAFDIGFEAVSLLLE